MKRLLTLALGLALTTGYATQAQAQPTTQQEREVFRAQMMKSYQDLVVMSDADWTKAMTDGASKFQAEGKAANARVLQKLADPSMRAHALDLFKSKIDEASTNGLIWVNQRWWCYGLGCFWLAIMTVLTLDGEEAGNF